MKRLGLLSIAIGTALLFAIANIANALPYNTTPTIQRGPSLRLPANQAIVTRTTAPLVLFVNGTLGSDANTCLTAGAGACATIQGAINKLPQYIYDQTTVSVAPFDSGYGGFILSGNVLAAPGDGGTSTLHILGETLVNASGLTGTTVGTATGGSNTGGPINAWCSLATSGATLTTDQLKGYLLELTGGPGAGTVRAIISNDATNIITAGTCTAVPTNATTYAVRDPVLVTTPIVTSGQLDAGTGLIGIGISATWDVLRSNTLNVKVTNIGAVVSTAGGVDVVGPGQVALQNTRFITTLANGRAVSLGNGNNLTLQNMSARGMGTAGIGVGIVVVNGSATSFTTSNVYASGLSTAMSLGNIYGGGLNATQIESTNSATTPLQLRNSGGMQNIGTAVYCNATGATTGIDLTVTTAGYGANGQSFTTTGINNCATGFKLNGPHSTYISGTITLSGTITTLFDVSHSGIVRQVSALNSSGYTNFLVIDGTTLSSNTDVTTTYGGYVFSGSTGALFDATP